MTDSVTNTVTMKKKITIKDTKTPEASTLDTVIMKKKIIIKDTKTPEAETPEPQDNMKSNMMTTTTMIDTDQ